LQQTRSERLASTLAEARIDVAKIDAIVADRVAARRAKNWTESDRLRDELAALGVAIKDNKDGTTTWEPKR
jgi:cysteinyl-tRNA synthetase